MTQHIASAGSVEWSTPQSIVNAVKEVWGGQIDLDPCSNAHSVVKASTEWRLPESDGLVKSWGPYRTIYVNPPYGRTHMHKVSREILAASAFKELPPETKKDYRSTTIADWILLCQTAAGRGSEVMTLIPAAVDTSHWHRYIFGKASVCFFRGRVKFLMPPGADTTKNQPPMGTAIVYFGSQVKKFEEVFSSLGFVVTQPSLQGAV